MNLRKHQWAGYIQRMGDSRIRKRAFKENDDVPRLVGKLRKRYEDSFDADIIIIKYKELVDVIELRGLKLMHSKNQDPKRVIVHQEEA